MYRNYFDLSIRMDLWNARDGKQPSFVYCEWVHVDYLPFISLHFKCHDWACSLWEPITSCLSRADGRRFPAKLTKHLSVCLETVWSRCCLTLEKAVNSAELWTMIPSRKTRILFSLGVFFVLNIAFIVMSGISSRKLPWPDSNCSQTKAVRWCNCNFQPQFWVILANN